VFASDTALVLAICVWDRNIRTLICCRRAISPGGSLSVESVVMQLVDTDTSSSGKIDIGP